MTAVLKTAELSEKERAFVRGVSVQGAIRETPMADPAAESVAPLETLEPTPTAPQTPRATLRVIPSMVSLSTRVPAELHERLMRASFERKLEHREPYTHQDIITEALTAWLKKAGYP